jgi:CheY-like chemotaxis protein
VLCIDNEPAILDGMQTLLEGWGCKVNTASTFVEAAAIADQGTPPDIIIADYHLDGGDGLSVIRKLREQLDADIPAILITADRGQTVRDDARALGLEVLHKPLRPAALRALLAQLCAARPAAE